MDSQKMNTTELIEEIEVLRKRVSQLEAAQAEHERVEQALQRSQELYRLLAENVSDVIWTMDMNLNYTYISPSVERMRGYTAQEALSQKIEDVFTAESCNTIRQSFREELALARDEGRDSYRSRTLEVQLKCMDGSVRWAEVKAAFLPDKEGQPAGVLGITRDINERKCAEQTIRRKLELEKTLALMSSRFIGDFDADKAIDASLEDMGRYTGVSRAYVFLLNGDESAMSNTHEWCAEGVSPQKDNLQNLPVETVPWWMKKLRAGEVIFVADVSELPVEAGVEKEILESQDIKSLLVMPLYVGGRLTGFTGFDDVKRTGTWCEEDLLVLPVFADVLGRALKLKEAEGELRRYAAELEKVNRELERLVAEVRELSLTDELTKLYNRRGFLTLAEQQLRIANRTGRGLSLFYFDLDNMKRINDELGHKTGDKALKETARILNRTFRDSDIIARIGGDEFVVMAIESPEGGTDGFTSRLWKSLERRNRRANLRYHLSLSMGIAHYDAASPCLIEDLLSRADRLMYKDKRAKRKS